MDIIRPMQLGFNHRVLEQNRKFYFTASSTLGINLQTGEEQIDALYLKDAFQGNPDDPPLLDVGCPKPNGEFIVSGSFHAPGKKTVTGGEVKVRVGNIEKNLNVFGPRKWKNGFPTDPEEIMTVPLIYQNAFGGEEYENNPVGKGYKDGLMPLIEYPNNLVASERDNPDPACFSALDPMVSSRMQYKGTYAADYKEKYFPGYPEDFDWKYFCCTPDDQWANGFFKGDEDFEIYNMHPEISIIKGSLPGLYARCFINQEKEGDVEFGEIPLHLDTIWLFPEKMLGLLTFRGVVEIEDDEAEDITHVLGAYEYLSKPQRSLEYYKEALEKRIKSDDVFLTLLTTSDLIPENHKCAMELLFDMGASQDSDESPLIKNAEAKAEAMKAMTDEKVEKAMQDAEKHMGDIPDDVKANISDKTDEFDIRKLMEKKHEVKPDPEVEILNQKMESILPGITQGDATKMDMKNFSFEKISQASDVAIEFSNKKKEDAQKQIKEKLENARKNLRKQIDDIDIQIDKAQKTGDRVNIKALEDLKEQLENSNSKMEVPDFDKPPEKTEMPRIDSEMILSQLEQAPSFPPEAIEAMQHIQAKKAMGIDDEETKELEDTIVDIEKKYEETMEASRKEIEENLAQVEVNFKDGYRMGAHYLGECLSPHKVSVEEIKNDFLKAISNKENVSGKDWACIDLSGENLDGIDLSGTFLEQVSFKGASLKGANLSKSIMARANLEDADFSGANLEEANVGAVNGLRANFSGANLKLAKLSKSDFSDANFTGADLEEIESRDLIIDRANLSEVHISSVFFLETKMAGAKFSNANIDLSMFIKHDIEEVDFKDAVLSHCAFIDIHFNNVCFDKADLSNCAFVTSSPENSSMNNITFREGILFQTNMQNMVMKDADFSNANLEKAFFWGADLTGANLSGAYAKDAQFKKAKLTDANLDNINLYQGSLTKAHLVNASFKGANLCQADFLRSTITNTDFSKANLDMTLIEHWRPS